MKKEFEWEQFPTLQCKEILAELLEAAEEPAAKMIIASTGLGKTNAITLFKKKRPQNTFVVTLGESYSRNDMLIEIAELTGCPPWYSKNSKHRNIREISRQMKELADQGIVPVLVLDECENARIPLLKSIKELYDGFGKKCSIVLIGTEQLIAQLDKKALGQSIPQLRRRFKAGTRFISPLKKARDFKPFFQKYIPDHPGIQDLLLRLCDNYGELHDYLQPVLKKAYKADKPVSEEIFRLFHKIDTED